MRGSGEGKFKVDFWLKLYEHEGAILSDRGNWERNQLKGMTESYFKFISYFFHSGISFLCGESVCFTFVCIS